MKTIRLLMVLAFVALTSSIALAAPMQAGAAPSPTSFMPAAAEIGQQIQELVTGEANVEIEPQETFGTRALGLIFSTAKVLVSGTADFVDNFAALPQFSVWVSDQANNPAFAQRWIDTGTLMLLAMGGAFLVGWCLDLLLLPVRRRLYKGTYGTWLTKSLGLLAWLVVSVIPILVYVAAAAGIVDYNDPSKLVRFIVFSFVYAAALMRFVRLGLRLLFMPRSASLRLIAIEPAHASYIQSWVTWYAAIMLFGYFLIDIANVVKVPSAAIYGFRSLMALAIVVMTIIVILQKRSLVSSTIRGDLSAAQAHQSLIGNLRLWLARTWHVLAIGYLIIGYFVTMLGPSGGFITMQKGTVGTLFALLLIRFAFFMAVRLSVKKKEGADFGLFRPILRIVLKILALIVGLGIVAASWGEDMNAIISSAWGQRILGSTFSIGSTVLGLAFLYELIHAAVERKLNKCDAWGRPIEAGARAKTLLPMARYAALAGMSLIAGVVTLSELGINTGPLLAGAGVLGVAVGFGSQTLVKDFLTGLFIILEDNISVGDIVAIGDNAGVVESMNIRTVRLRDNEGNLHILPFSEISRIVNSSKGFAYAMMDVGVSYSCDLKKAMKIMVEVGDAMAKEEAFATKILAPTEIMGVESLGDSAVVLRCRIKTFGGKQWEVRRAYLLRLKLRFDEESIEIPFPQRVVYHRYEGQAPVGAVIPLQTAPEAAVVLQEAAIAPVPQQQPVAAPVLEVAAPPKAPAHKKRPPQQKA